VSQTTKIKIRKMRKGGLAAALQLGSEKQKNRVNYAGCVPLRESSAPGHAQYPRGRGLRVRKGEVTT